MSHLYTRERYSETLKVLSFDTFKYRSWRTSGRGRPFSGCFLEDCAAPVRKASSLTHALMWTRWNPSGINSPSALSLSLLLSRSLFLYSYIFSVSPPRVAFSGLARSHARHPRQATPANEPHTETSAPVHTNTRTHTHRRATHKPEALQGPRANNSRHKHTPP